MQSKYIEVEVNNENALNALLRELQNLNLLEQIYSNTSANPNTIIENFMNLLAQAKKKCMSNKLAKFDKKKTTIKVFGLLMAFNNQLIQKIKCTKIYYKLTQFRTNIIHLKYFIRLTRVLLEGL